MEFVVAIFILMIGLLALLQAINVSYRASLASQLRIEAVSVADEAMAKQKATSFDQLPVTTLSYSSSRLVGGAWKMYSTTVTGAAVSNNTKNLQIAVAWKYKGSRFVHQLSTLISRSSQ